MNEERRKAIQAQLEEIAARHAKPPPDPDEFFTTDYMKYANLSRNTADGHLRAEVGAGRLAVRKVRNPESGRICNAYRKVDNTAPAA